jgi:hypothetical protein
MTAANVLWQRFSSKKGIAPFDTATSVNLLEPLPVGVFSRCFFD